MIIDRREDKNCTTGQFELLYKQPNIPEPSTLDKAMLIIGQKVKKKQSLYYNLYLKYIDQLRFKHFNMINYNSTNCSDKENNNERSNEKPIFTLTK